MVDKTSWTEPLDSGQERSSLGIECCGVGGEGRDGECMSDERGVPGRKWRCVHYVRVRKSGQRGGTGRVRVSRGKVGFAMGQGRVEEVLDAHGGGRGSGAMVATR
jgi:hypothetical protein